MRQSFIEAFRSLRRERASSLLALVCLSIAIGTNTTVFSIVNGLILRDLPLRSLEASYSDPSDFESTSVRVDDRTTARLSIFARFNHAPSSTTVRSGPLD